MNDVKGPQCEDYSGMLLLLAEPKIIFLVLIGKCQKSTGSITGELINIVKYDVSTYLHLAISV